MVVIPLNLKVGVRYSVPVVRVKLKAVDDPELPIVNTKEFVVPKDP